MSHAWGDEKKTPQRKILRLLASIERGKMKVGKF